MGGKESPAGVHSPHAGHARQFGSARRQRAGSGGQCGVIWLPESRSRSRSTPRSRAGPRASVYLLRRGRPARQSVRGARRGSAAFGVGLLIGPEGGFEEAERARSFVRRACCVSASARASCAPTPPPSPRSRWFRRGSGIGSGGRGPDLLPSGGGGPARLHGLEPWPIPDAFSTASDLCSMSSGYPAGERQL